jgi:hypothetical protein
MIYCTKLLEEIQENILQQYMLMYEFGPDT